MISTHNVIAGKASSIGPRDPVLRRLARLTGRERSVTVGGLERRLKSPASKICFARKRVRPAKLIIPSTSDRSRSIPGGPWGCLLGWPSFDGVGLLLDGIARDMDSGVLTLCRAFCAGVTERLNCG